MLPNFLIIGAARAGTTSLYTYLSEHPDVYMSPNKEPRFFGVQGLEIDMNDPVQARSWAGTVTRWDDYVRLFDGVTTEKAIGEASPLYLAWSERSAQAIRERLPDVKLIACLRQPVERAFSHYLHNLELGIEQAPTFEEALAGRGQWTYLQLGYYAKRLREFYDRFSRDQIRIYLFRKDLTERTEYVFRDLCQFLEVDPFFPAQVEKRHNAAAPGMSIPLVTPVAKAAASLPALRNLARQVLPRSMRSRAARLIRPATKQKSLDPETRRKFTHQYRDDILQLQGMLDRDLSHWLAD